MVDGKWGFIDQSGEFVIKPEYVVVYSFSEGFAKVCFGDRTAGLECEFIDQKGNLMDATVYPEGFFSDDFISDGYVPVFYGERGNENLLGLDFMDPAGNFLFGQKKLMNARAFSEGLAAVSPYETGGSLWGYSDTSGTIMIDAKYPAAQPFHDGRAAVKIANSGEVTCQGIRAVDSLWGFIDPTGKSVIPNQYSEVGAFSDGLAKVQGCEDQKWSYVNIQGSVVIPPADYLEAGDFENGYAEVTVENGKTRFGFGIGVIDKNGDFVIPPDNEAIKPFFYAKVVAVQSYDMETNVSKWEWINLETEKVIFTYVEGN